MPQPCPSAKCGNTTGSVEVPGNGEGEGGGSSGVTGSVVPSHSPAWLAIPRSAITATGAEAWKEKVPTMPATSNGGAFRSPARCRKGSSVKLPRAVRLPAVSVR